MASAKLTYVHIGPKTLLTGLPGQIGVTRSAAGPEPVAALTKDGMDQRWQYLQ